MSFENQSTDSENSKAPTGSKSAGNAPTLVDSASAQKIAQNRDNQNTITGSGAPPVTANSEAGS